MQYDNFLPYLSYVQKKRAHDLSKKTSMIIDSIKFSAQKYKNAAIAYKKEYDENKYERVKIKDFRVSFARCFVGLLVEE